MVLGGQIWRHAGRVRAAKRVVPAAVPRQA
jgi:hypothetical protein